jgi:hypothetical protein
VSHESRTMPAAWVGADAAAPLATLPSATPPLAVAPGATALGTTAALRRKGVQFGLGRLFVATAVCGVLFAFVLRLGMVAAALAFWWAVLIAAHVSANAWGARRRRAAPPPEGRPIAAPPLAMLQAQGAGDQLRTRRSLGRAFLGAAGASGLLLGGLGGAWGLTAIGVAQRTWPGFALGVVSAGVLGALAALLFASLARVAARALAEGLEPSRGRSAIQ